ncbi:MAG: hypothetical protein ACUVWR_12485 [Anaerolineae bacterium]
MGSSTLVTPRRPATPTYVVVLPLVLAVALLLGAGAVRRLHLGGQANPPPMPRSPAVEEKYGVRFTFLAVTAEGGLIDVRYRVVDADKAKNFGHYTETAPMLIAEETGQIVGTYKMGMHNHRVQTGYIYHILFRNSGGAIKPGMLVTIQINDLKLDHVVAQ